MTKLSDLQWNAQALGDDSHRGHLEAMVLTFVHQSGQTQNLTLGK
jgi:hypothetical protein